MRDLPRGWEWANLGEVAQYVNGRGFKKSEWSNHGRPIIRIQNLTGSGSTFNYFAGELEDRYVVRPGDLLISWAATLAVHVWNENHDGALNQHIFKVIPRIDARYLRYALEFALTDLRKQTHGSGMVHITRGRFEGTPIAVPPLAEQGRIVHALEDHLSRLHAAASGVDKSKRRVARWAALSTLGAFQSAAVQRWSTIGEVCKVHVGATPSRSDPLQWNGNLPWVSSGEVDFKTIYETKEHINQEKIRNPLSRIHPPGTVLLAMIGEGKTRGQVATLGVAAAHNQNCASIRVDESPLESKYLYHFLKGRYEETRSNGSGGVQPALNKSKVQSIKVPIVSQLEQERVVEAAEQIEATKARLQDDLSKVIVRADRLRRALLQAALTGLLIDQDPADEPASALLARIAVSAKKPKADARRPVSREVQSS